MKKVRITAFILCFLAGFTAPRSFSVDWHWMVAIIGLWLSGVFLIWLSEGETGEWRMSYKVSGGTPKGFRSLCSNCRLAQHVRGLNMQEVTMCRAYNNPLRITFPVETCTIYDDKRVPSLYQMEQIAWAVTSRSRGAVGFGGNEAQEIHIEPPMQNPQVPQGQPPITGELKSSGPAPQKE